MPDSSRKDFERRVSVFGSAADPLSGTDMTQWCHDAGCHKLQPGGWVCFAAHAPFK